MKPFFSDHVIVNGIAEDIRSAVEKHLGFKPECFVLILSNDRGQAETMGAGLTPAGMSILLQAAVANHVASTGHRRFWGKQP